MVETFSVAGADSQLAPRSVVVRSNRRDRRAEIEGFDQIEASLKAIYQLLVDVGYLNYVMME